MKKLYTLAAITALAIGLSACSTVGNLFTDPQTDLNTVEAGFAVAEMTYDAICAIGSPPSFCTDPKAIKAYADAKAALQTSFKTAQDAINAGDGTVAIEALIQDAVTDLAAYEAIVSDIQAKNRAGAV